MKFIPNSGIKNEMIKEIGLKTIDDLFSDIPKDVLIKDLDLPAGFSQQKTHEELKNIAKMNKPCSESICFLGAGIKPHYIPAAVRAITSRSEFFTAYTPYQSEASQGFLQAMFEYQSMIAELTGMDISNCSLYDGVTALSEAVLMCHRINKKNKFIISKSISQDKKSVLHNYTKGPGIKIHEVDYDDKTGRIDIEKLEKLIDEETSGVYIEQPNYFGVFEQDIEKINSIVKKAGALFVVGVDLLSLGIVKPPGKYGADIVIGEGRVFGNSMDFGGCGLGVFASKKEYLRQMPGRIIGLTEDSQGKRAFCMAMQTREQHIRRARATSNICTNEGLCALNTAVHLAWLGEERLRKLAEENLNKAIKLKKMISTLKDFELRFDAINFNEFVIKSKIKPKKIKKQLLYKNIQIGPCLDKDFSELSDCILVGVTELNSDEDFNKLIKYLKEVN